MATNNTETVSRFTAINTDAVLAWFTGKGRANAERALAILIAAVLRGFWNPGESRSTRAILNKANVAVLFVRKNMKAFEAFGCDKEARYSSGEPLAKNGFNLEMAMLYGSYGYLASVDFAAMAAGARNDLERIIASKGRAFAEAFGPVGTAMTQLDALRPPPVFTVVGISRTLTATVASLGLPTDGAALARDAVTVCPMEWYKVEGENFFRSRLVWPKGTIHNATVHAGARGDSAHCHACGHAIRNAFNWVPLVVRSQGKVYGLWTGMDCAKSLFGIKMTGEARYSEGPAVVKENA